ncbi:MAG: pyruvate kinase, partial [Alphaproteobacteria bacterium]|nr:pyruvate kinase [Alphaproteobacteria bacterium]
ALARAGADVFRLNFSHGRHEDHKARLDIIRAVEKKIQRPIGVLLDLQGPKLRVATFKAGSIALTVGQKFRLHLNPVEGDEQGVTLPHPEVFAVMKPGLELLLDDGKVRLTVEAHGADYADTVVTAGSVLSDRKGLNVPGAILPLPAVTEKDRQDLAFGLTLDIDWVALSFVQRPEDVVEARQLAGDKVKLMVKLEKPSAMDCLDELIALADGVMVARGDLGVELPPEQVPGLQKRIVRACRQAGKPVVVATQMLDSMVSNPAPTRAEASDVATAIFDGADAVMLSAESASGQFPVESVAMMNRIIETVERDVLYRPILEAVHGDPAPNVMDAITVAACKAAQTVAARLIVCFSSSGKTALSVARERPYAPILGLTPQSLTARQLAIVWGIHPQVIEDIHNFDEMVDTAKKFALANQLAARGDTIVVTAGVPFGQSGATNVLRIVTIA